MEPGSGHWFGAGGYLGGEPNPTDDYLDTLIEGLPPGSYSRREDAEHVRDLAAAAAALANECALDVVILEADGVPDQAVDTLDRWESVLGVQSPAGASLDSRRLRLLIRCRERNHFRAEDVRHVVAPLLGIAPPSVEIIERTPEALAKSAAVTRVPAATIPDGGEVSDTIHSLQEGLTQRVAWVHLVLNHPRLADLRVGLWDVGGTEIVLLYPGQLSGAGEWSGWLPALLDPGEAAVGPWRLTVRDSGAGGTGIFGEWTLALVNDLYGRRAFGYVVYRDPSLGGTYDLEAAFHALRRAGHAHTDGAAVDHLDFLTDDEHSMTDRNVLSEV